MPSVNDELVVHSEPSFPIQDDDIDSNDYKSNNKTLYLLQQEDMNIEDMYYVENNENKILFILIQK